MNSRKVILAGDHHSVDLIKVVAEQLSAKSVNFELLGSKNKEDKVTLQALIPEVVKFVIDNDGEAVLICGTGIGVEIGANRFKGIRASLCTNPKTAENAKVYDNANVLCLSAWETNDPGPILDAWFEYSYDGSESRLEMFGEFDRWAK